MPIGENPAPEVNLARWRFNPQNGNIWLDVAARELERMQVFDEVRVDERLAERAPSRPQTERTKNGPELWDKILSAVREIYEPEFVAIAGGAVRDYLLGEENKDIDVWVKCSGKVPSDRALEVAEELGWKEINPVYTEYKNNGDSSNVLNVFSGSSFGHRIDFIVIDKTTGKEVVDRFDAEINKCWYDGQVHTTPAARLDIQKRQWSSCLPDNPAAEKRFLRVNKRLGGKLKFKPKSNKPWYSQFAEKAKISR